MTPACTSVQCARGSVGGALAVVELGLAPGPGPAGIEAVAVAADLSVVEPSRVPAAISVAAAPQGLAALSAFGAHRATGVSAGSPRLHRVGLETEARAAVTSGAALVVTGTLAEARAAAGEDIRPPRRCLRMGHAAVARVGKRMIASQRC